jgi:nucleotide-binding universal stress UspA family protein
MDKILLTTDFSEKAMTINSYAIDLFGTQVNYILLTGFICDYAQAAKTEGQTFANAEEFRQYRHDRAMTKLNDEKEKLALTFPGIEIKCKAIEGVAIRAIESATRLYSPDLVVVGSSRLANAPTRNHASVATRLIGTLPANLLIVPNKHDCPTVKKIVYAYSQTLPIPRQKGKTRSNHVPRHRNRKRRILQQHSGGLCRFYGNKKREN